MRDKPDLSETLPPPTPLRRAAIVSFVWGADHFDIVCIAASMVREPDPTEGGEPIDWLHIKGYQGGRFTKIDPSGTIVTRRYLIPAKYVLHIGYGGRFQIVQKNESPDIGIFPLNQPIPEAALPLGQIRQIIEGLQVRPGVPEPLMYDNYVRDVSDRFEQALARIKAEHNFEFGAEFEIAICKTLRTVLPQKYGICRGYVVSAFGEKAGDDIIIYDRMRFPTLRALESDDFAAKEQVPVEAVYAYIEAKHSICIDGNGGTSFQKALTQVAQVKILCDRRASVSLQKQDIEGESKQPPVGWPQTRNPAYGLILSRHVRQREGGPIIEDPDVILSLLAGAKVSTLLPPDVCVFGKCNMCIPVVSLGTDDRTNMPSPFFLPGASVLHTSIVDGVGFGAGLSMLLWALDWIELGTMPWPEILEDCIPPNSPRPIAENTPSAIDEGNKADN